MSVSILTGDCREVLAGLPDQHFHTCVTSPPYFGLRDYGVEGQLGLEPTPDEFVAALVAVFREVRRVLRDDGTVWLNLGDSYASGGRKSRDPGRSKIHPSFEGDAYADGLRPDDPPGVKPKDLIGIPWMVAFALRADGWYLRQDIIWSKPNPMPESVRDRCTKAHEYLFMLSKSPRYYYDADAIKNPPSEALLEQVRDGYSGNDTKDYASGGAQSASGTKARIIERAREKIDKQRGHSRRHAGFNDRWDGLTREQQIALGSNKRSVWEVTTKPYSEAHFATFPPALVEPCIKAGSPVGGHVLDPFGGAGTTGLVADRLQRHATLIELNPDYADLSRKRIDGDAPLLTRAAE